MANKHFYRHTIRAEIGFEIAYDPTDPASYGAALAMVEEKRKGLRDIGAAITKDDGAPKVVRE